MPLGPPLRRRFYARDARDVGPALIGCRLVHRLPGGIRLVVRLTEVEAYLGDGSDPASHAHPGPTPRNGAMFGPAGRLYAYRSYGIHTCVNVVCEVAGRGAAVLLRAAEPLEGLDAMRRLRGLGADAPPHRLTVGPGRLGQALGLTLADDGRSLLGGALRIHPPPGASAPVGASPRVGITKAADLPYRYFEIDAKDRPTRWVSAFRRGGRRRPA
ncbi:MAG: DNA-3-methyladenine glycosylase [Myxococcota bacterium]